MEPAAYRGLPEILGQGVKVHVYSGDLDALLNHWGTELVMQNMTWYAMVLFLPGAVSVSVFFGVFHAAG